MEARQRADCCRGGVAWCVRRGFTADTRRTLSAPRQFLTQCALALLLGASMKCALAEDRQADNGGGDHPCCEVSVEQNGGPLLLVANWRDAEAEARGGGPKQGGTSVTLLLDTGADHSCFDLSRRPLLGKPVGGFADREFDNKIIEAYAPPRLDLGGFAIQPRGDVPCVDLRWLSRPLGRSLDGLLGMDALRSLAVSIDFDRGVLRLARAPGKPAGELVPLLWRGEPGAEGPYVLAALGGAAPLEFLIDTGGIHNVAGTLETRVFDRLCERGVLSPIRNPGRLRVPGSTTRSGTSGVSVARAGVVRIGDVAVPGPIFARHPRVNSLGLGYLSRFALTFDFPRGAMYLRRGKRFSHQDTCYDLAAFSVHRDGERTLVRTIREPTAGADIRVGDELVAINSRATRTMSVFSIRRALALEARQVLDFLRGGAARQVVLDFRDEIRTFQEANGAAATAAEQNQP